MAFSRSHVAYGDGAHESPAPRPTGDDATVGDLSDIFAFMRDEGLGNVLGEVTAVSGKRESLYTSPASITVLDREAIRFSAARTIPDLLRQVPGIQVSQLAPGNYAVSVRGTAGAQSNNLVMLIDGIPFNNPFDSAIDWSALPITIDDVDKIEIVRGPVSTIYGADAFTGVIAIKTRQARGIGTSGDVILGGGVDTRVKPGGTAHVAVGGTNEKVSWRSSAYGTFDALQSVYTQQSLGRQTYLPGAALAGGGTAGRLRIRPTPDHQVDIIVGGGAAQASALDSWVLENVPQVVQHANAGVFYDINRLGKSAHSLKIWSTGRFLGRSADESKYASFNYDDLKSYHGRAGSKVSFALPYDISLALGAEGSITNTDAPFIHPGENNIPRGAWGFFLQGSQTVAEMFRFEAAGRVDISAFTRDPQASGRGSIIFFRDFISVRGSIGTAYRNPTFVELASRFTDPATGLILLEGLAGIQAPRSYAAELAAIVGLFGSRLTVRPTTYLQRLRHLVVGDFTPLVRKTFRTDSRDVDVFGAELELDYRPLDWLSAHLAGHYLHFLTTGTDPAATIGDKNHNSQLILRGELRGRWLDNRLIVGVATSVVSGRQYDVSAGIPPALLPRYQLRSHVRVETKVAWQMVSSLPLSLDARVAAIVPEGINEVVYPQAGTQRTRFWLGLTYEWR